jgi:chemotaxis protein methyltransferase CheR
VWSAGCASGEEPYTLAIIWALELAYRFPTLANRILATDLHPIVLARARRACFSAGSSENCQSAGAKQPSRGRTRATACASATSRP